jgi:hypothetical protein
MPAQQSNTQRVQINASANGNNTLVAAVVGRRIRVLGAVLVAAGTVSPQFQSGASGSALTGAMPMVANGVLTLPFNPEGWFETAVNTLLNLNLSGAIGVTGVLQYVEVTP